MIQEALNVIGRSRDFEDIMKILHQNMITTPDDLLVKRTSTHSAPPLDHGNSAHFCPSQEEEHESSLLVRGGRRLVRVGSQVHARAPNAELPLQL